jgi:hypothetical protein
VHERLRRDADRTGLVDYGADDLAAALPGR